MILITGATGNIGKAIIDFLLNKGIAPGNIAALVRDEAKAADLKSRGILIKVGDYNDYETLAESFIGIDKLLLVSGSDIVNRAKQQENVVKAAQVAGVNHIYYTSFERKNDTETSPIEFLAKSHIATENLIKASGLTYTIFRNNLYLEVLPMFFGENVLETGIFLPAGETKAAFALRTDMAEAIANVLSSQGHENKEYSLSNTEKISFEDAAEAMSTVTGKHITYTSPTVADYSNTLSQAGVPMEYIDMFAGFAEAIKQGEFETEKTDLVNLLGRTPTSAKAFFAQVYSAQN